MGNTTSHIPKATNDTLLLRIKRFNYWAFIDVNPIYKDDFAQGSFDFKSYLWMFNEEFCCKCKRDFEEARLEKNKDIGEEKFKAIFKFAKNNPFFLQYDWVIQALQDWVLWGSDTFLKKRASALLFRDKRGKRHEANPTELKKVIERHKRIFIDILSLKKKGMPLTAGADLSRWKKSTPPESIYSKLDKIYPTGVSNINDINKEYSKLYKSQKKFVNSRIDDAIKLMLFRMFSKIEKDLYQEISSLLAERNNPTIKQLDDKYSFARSLLSNDFCNFYKGDICDYYPFGFNDKGFIRFLKDCKLTIRKGKIWLPFHNYLLNCIKEAFEICEDDHPHADFISEHLKDIRLNRMYGKDKHNDFEIEDPVWWTGGE